MDVRMDRAFINLACEYLKKIYELTIKSPDKPVNCNSIETVTAIDEITTKRIIEFLEDNMLIRLQSGGCVTITMEGMDKVVNDDIHKYCEELDNTMDPTYYSQYK